MQPSSLMIRSGLLIVDTANHDNSLPSWRDPVPSHRVPT
jgi:hypothetical protein